MAISWGSKKIVAIDWDRSWLRMALVRIRGDDLDLLKAVSVPVPSDVRMDDAEHLGAFVREAMRQSHIGVKHAIMNIPREKVVLNTLNLPPTPSEEMASVVRFQIAKELPFSEDEATIDFAVPGGHDPNASSTTLVAAVRHDDLTFYREVAHEAGLTIDRISLRPYDNLLAVMSGFPDLSGRSLMVVEVGPMLTEIDIVQSGTLTFSRAASVPLQGFNDQETPTTEDSSVSTMAAAAVASDETRQDVVDRLMVEVNRSFEAHRATDPSVKIEHMIICGATGFESSLAESLSTRFSARSRFFSPERSFGLSPQRAKELRGFSAVLGLSLGEGLRGLTSFDFLHPKRPISKRSLQMKKLPTALVTAALLLASGIVYYSKYVAPKQKDVENLQSLVARLQKRKKPIKAFTAQVEAMEDWKRSEQYWPDLLVAMTKAFPPPKNAYVSRLSFDTRTQRKSTERISTIKLKLRTSRLGLVNDVSESFRSLGLTKVSPGPESLIGSNRREETTYRYDTSLNAGIPLRPDSIKRHSVTDEHESDDNLSQKENEDSLGGSSVKTGVTKNPADAKTVGANDSGGPKR